MKNARFHIPTNLFIIFFLAVSSAGAALQIKPATAVQAAPAPAIGFIAYNDCNFITGDLNTNITTYNCANDNGGGYLKNYADGSVLSASVEIHTDGAYVNSAGTESALGTDAYNAFHNFVSTTGGIRFNDDDDYVTLIFKHLDRSKTYTFTTTANDPTRTDSGSTSFMIWGLGAPAINTSTTGATITSNFFTGDTTTFNTKNNTNNGYVARWTNIDPGVDGIFAVTISQTNNHDSAGPSAFVLQQSPYPTVTTTTPGPTTGVLDPVTSTTGYPSNSDTFTCGGTSLLGNILVSATAPYQVSIDNINFSPTLTLTATAGVVSPTTIYVQLNSNTAGDFSGTVTCTSLGTTDKSVTISGTTYDPAITLAGSLTPFTSTTNYLSASQTFTCAGVHLVSDITVTAPAPYEVSLNGTTYSSSVDIPETSGTADATTVYARLNSATAGDFSGNISCTATGAIEQDAAVNGTTHDPVITLDGTLNPFTSIPNFASVEQSYTVSASYLVEDLVITAPANYEVSLTSGSGFGSSVSLTPDVTGTVASTTIYVRLLNANPGNTSGNITHISSGAEEDQPVSGFTQWVYYIPIVQFNQ